MKVSCGNSVQWEPGDHIYLDNGKDQPYAARLIRKFGHYLYLYTKADLHQPPERRKLPRLRTHEPCQVFLGTIGIHAEVTDMNWEGFTLQVNEESSRLQMKLYKLEGDIRMKLDGQIFETPVRFIHGKSSQTKVGIVLGQIKPAVFEHLCEYLKKLH